jgi:hypothetical protein
MPLNTEANLDRPDDFYEALIEMHQGLDQVQSEAVNAHLILLLANHIGHYEVLREAMELARAAVPAPGDASA